MNKQAFPQRKSWAKRRVKTLKKCISGSHPGRIVSDKECEKCPDLEICTQIKKDLGLVDP